MTPLPPLLVRADAGPGIGWGHALRCLAVAEAWLEAGGAVTLAFASCPRAVQERYRTAGVATTELAQTAASQGEAEETRALADRLGARWAIVDGYTFSPDYVAALKADGLRVLQIDDGTNEGPWRADLLLNPNLHAGIEAYASRSAGSRVLLGPRYALIRREFLEGRARREPPRPPRKILVALGGSDAQGLSRHAAELLRALPEELEVSMVVGEADPRRAPGPETARLRFLVDPQMGEAMDEADIALAASGSTSWELCYSGVPSVLVPVAKNQEPVATALEQAGAALAVRPHATVQEMAEALTRLVRDPGLREGIRARALAMVDGFGPARIVTAMRATWQTLRPATMEDAKALWEWANEPVARQASFQSDPIPWEAHVSWLRTRLGDPGSRLWIGHDGEVPLGVVRLEAEGETATVSVNLAPASRGRGHGPALIRRACDEVADELGIRTFRAFIKPSNRPSLRAFARAGFTFQEETEIRGQPASLWTLRSDVP